jgi:hypothetical protein
MERIDRIRRVLNNLHQEKIKNQDRIVFFVKKNNGWQIKHLFIKPQFSVSVIPNLNVIPNVL